MSRRIEAVSSRDNGSPCFFLISREGAIVQANLPATFVASRVYFADVPTTLGPAGQYTMQLRQTGNDALRAGGSFYWNGTDVVAPQDQQLGVADVENVIDQSLIDYDGLTASAYSAGQAVTVQRFDDVDQQLIAIDGKLDTVLSNLGTLGASIADIIAGQAAIEMAIDDVEALVTNLSIPTAAAIATAVQAGILNEGDGQTVIDALVDAIQAGFGDDADGNAILALIQAEVTTALINYAAARVGDITDTRDELLTEIADNATVQATATGQSALSNALSALAGTVAKETKQDTIVADIAALQNGTTTSLTALQQSANDNATAIAQLANAGATDAQVTILQGLVQQLVDDMEADFEQTPQKLTKFLQGTTTVLKEIDYTGVPTELPTFTGVHV